jgi:Ureidoglycolate hydrolase.
MSPSAIALRPFGTLLPQEDGETVAIPYYSDRVEEGAPLDLQYRGRLMARTARIQPTERRSRWLERHRHLNQLFVNLSLASFGMVLCAPTGDDDAALPNPRSSVAFELPTGSALLLHRGTWHDFPFAITEPVVVLTFSSEEVIAALTAVESPVEINGNDVQKISLRDRFGIELEVFGNAGE